MPALDAASIGILRPDFALECAALIRFSTQEEADKAVALYKHTSTAAATRRRKRAPGPHGGQGRLPLVQGRAQASAKRRRRRVLEVAASVEAAPTHSKGDVVEARTTEGCSSTEWHVCRVEDVLHTEQGLRYKVMWASGDGTADINADAVRRLTRRNQKALETMFLAWEELHV